MTLFAHDLLVCDVIIDVLNKIMLLLFMAAAALAFVFVRNLFAVVSNIIPEKFRKGARNR